VSVGNRTCDGARNLQMGKTCHSENVSEVEDTKGRCVQRQKGIELKRGQETCVIFSLYL
jgi:hypothetical protein